MNHSANANSTYYGTSESAALPRSMSNLESNLHSAGSTMSSVEQRMRDIIARLTGPVPQAVEKPQEQMAGLVALSERNVGQANGLYELIERLDALV